MPTSLAADAWHGGAVAWAALASRSLTQIPAQYRAASSIDVGPMRLRLTPISAAPAQRALWPPIFHRPPSYDRPLLSEQVAGY